MKLTVIIHYHQSVSRHLPRECALFRIRLLHMVHYTCMGRHLNDLRAFNVEMLLFRSDLLLVFFSLSKHAGDYYDGAVYSFYFPFATNYFLLKELPGD